MSFTLIQTSNFSGEFQKVFSKKLLPYAVQALVLDQFGQKVPFPKEAGATQMRFVRFDAPDDSNVQSLTEGTPISVSRNQTITTVDATLAQYGEAYQISDVMTWTQLYDHLQVGIKQMGQDIAKHAEKLIRNELVSAITTQAGSNKRYAQGISSWANLSAASTSAGCTVLTDILDAFTTLQVQRAPKINGEYVYVVPPQVARDLMNDQKFILANQYGTQKGMYKGEVGTWYGCRIVIQTYPFREATNGAEGTYAGSGGIYVSLALGSDCYGIPLMTGQSPFDPKVMICDKPDKADPANQYITAAIKAFWAVKTLNATWGVVVRSLSQYS